MHFCNYSCSYSCNYFWTPMDDDEFSFKFPDIDFKSMDCTDMNRETINKINEYLDKDIEDQLVLLQKLREFEKRIDAIL